MGSLQIYVSMCESDYEFYFIFASHFNADICTRRPTTADSTQVDTMSGRIRPMSSDSLSNGLECAVECSFLNRKEIKTILREPFTTISLFDDDDDDDYG